MQVEFDGMAEGECVGDVLVVEDVELADLDVGGWEAGGVGESGGGCSGRVDSANEVEQSVGHLVRCLLCGVVADAFEGC